MQFAQDGIIKLSRGFAALLVVLFGTFAAASRHDDTAPGACTSVDGAGSCGNLQDLVSVARQAANQSELEDQHADSAAADDGNLIEAFAVAKNAQWLFVPLMIDGQKWWFLVDTGCGETIVDMEVAIHVGLIDRPKPDLGRWHWDRRALSARIGKSSIPVECQAVCFDLSHLRLCHHAFPLCGILGMDVLRTHVISIDPDTGTLSFLKSVPECSGSQLKLSRDSDDRPILSVEVSTDKHVWFVVDTGCSGPYAGTFEKTVFTELVEQQELTVLRGRVARIGLSGRRMCDQGTLDVFHVGSFKHPDLEFHDHASNNLLGLGYLSRYVATLDFPNDALYLKEGKRFVEPARASDVPSIARPADGIAQPAIPTFPWQNTAGAR